MKNLKLMSLMIAGSFLMTSTPLHAADVPVCADKCCNRDTGAPTPNPGPCKTTDGQGGQINCASFYQPDGAAKKCKSLKKKDPATPPEISDPQPDPPKPPKPSRKNRPKKIRHTE
jgi:hypothetical protein